LSDPSLNNQLLPDRIVYGAIIATIMLILVEVVTQLSLNSVTDTDLTVLLE
jgi:hypothetical protein